MTERQQQHLGRHVDDEKEIVGRDVRGESQRTDDVPREVEDARDVQRRIDENERRTGTGDDER